MLPTIEKLELRRLLSSSAIAADVAALHSEEGDTKLTIKDWKTEAVDNYKTIIADLKGLDLLKVDKGVLKGIVKDSAATFALLSKDLSKDAASLNSAINMVVSAGKSLAKKPGNAKLEAVFSNASNKSTAAISTIATALTADAQHRVDTLTPDLDTLAATTSDEQFGTDIFNVERELQSRSDLLAQQGSNLQYDAEVVLSNFEP